MHFEYICHSHLQNSYFLFGLQLSEWDLKNWRNISDYAANARKFSFYSFVCFYLRPSQDCLKFFTDIGNTKTTQIFKEECRDKASSQIDEGREV